MGVERVPDRFQGRDTAVSVRDPDRVYERASLVVDLRRGTLVPDVAISDRWMRVWLSDSLQYEYREDAWGNPRITIHRRVMVP